MANSNLVHSDTQILATIVVNPPAKFFVEATHRKIMAVTATLMMTPKGAIWSNRSRSSAVT